jgi:uncharacterized protein YjbI with pentapeptide repeats
MKGRERAMTLEEALSFCPVPREPGEMLVVRGGPGSGKSTALALAAGYLGRHAIGVLDEPGQLELTAARLTGPVLAAFAVGPAPANALELCPWTDDDLIEYSLLNHSGACASIMKRVLAMADRHRLAGIPALWSAALDLLAAREDVRSVDDILSEIIRAHAKGWDLRKARNAAWSLLWLNRMPGKADERGLLLRYRPVRLYLQAQHLAFVLTQKSVGRVLKRIPPDEVIEAAKAMLIKSEKAIGSLRGAADGRNSSVHACAATLLTAIGVPWRPREGHVPVLEAARLDGARWDGCKLPRLRAGRASFVGASLSACDLTEAHLGGADLSGANLAGVVLEGAGLGGALLRDADLTRAVLKGAVLARADLSGACLEEALCEKARFSFATLDGVRAVRADLSDGHFEWTSVRGADFTAAVLSGSELTHVELCEAQIVAVRAEQTLFNRCNLAGLHVPAGSFRRARFLESDLTCSNMPAADFTGARLHNCGLADVEWEGATLRDADLTGSTFHMGSSRSGLVFSPIASEGTRTGFYTDDYDDRSHKHPEEIRKANLCGVDVRGAKVEGVDFYLVDLRRAKYDTAQAEWFRRCGAILKDHDE